MGTEQLARLDEVLADPRLQEKLRLVAVHHPPAGKAARSRGAGLRDHAELAEVLGARGAELVLHGHEHLDLEEEIPRAEPDAPAIPVRCIQSASFVGRNPAMRASYRIYEVAPAQRAVDGVASGRPVIAREELRSWSPESEGFAAATCAR